MKRLFVILPLLLLLFSCGNYRASRGPADWIYVSETGSDGTGDGSVGNPFATISHAATTASSGDTIFVQSGTITETATTTLPLGVSIYGEGATSIITTSSALDPIISAVSTAGDCVDGSHNISFVAFDGNSQTADIAIVSRYRSNVVVHDCSFVDFDENAVIIDGTSSNWDVTPTNVLASGCKVYNCDFVNCTSSAATTAGGHIRPEGTVGMEIYNCTFDQTTGGDAEDNDILKGFQNYGLQIYNNTLTRLNDNGSGWNFFAEIHYSHGGVDIYNNIFNGAAAFDLSVVVKGTYDYGAKVHHNIWRCDTAPADPPAHRSPSLDLESYDYENDIYVYCNYFKNVRTPIKLNNVGTSADNIWIYYNIIDGCGSSDFEYDSGISIESNWDFSDPTPMSNIHILNNTIYAVEQVYSGINVACFGDVTNIDIKNNIIYGNFGRPVRFTYTSGTPEVTNAVITYNDFYDNDNSAIYYSGSVTFTSCSESNNITTNPLFRTGSYRLQSTSPAINAGLYVGLTTDFAGHRVPQNDTVDIGAYEYGDYLFRTPSGKLLRNANGKFMISH